MQTIEKKPVIMVVDDEKDFADDLAEFIRSTGRYETLVCYSAQTALDALEKGKSLLGVSNRFRLVISDIKMFGMDGLQFLKKIRENYSAQQMGVIMLTAWEDAQRKQEAVGGDVLAYFHKPFNEEKLIETIDGFFSGKSQEMIKKTKDEILTFQNPDNDNLAK
ncbi:hypothetical protein A3J90_08480 [candidate division WOR-1 bacterium RIFOXYC2_FULL_37_10]|uniref:Response regulatory domain-containing protein n=1 Tax=candidate division WOR-1 bacterium RIFOXYB2_FULL_37_13 TaxID=1802579 RepID=A0A1F4SMJ5_UNCSA|nr:MAG: hypothetical protein A2246_00965 [candidate division WOR-1 bacterium RIFOXYA2_FULL_37_7]OGC21609.1 MAG: hypothetical protein A2310_02290 [candidate division WOR-1 bacterium RIFOXYB2_FULL_37_13]OGC33016.1 MAG: hypothetical protein A3J90_08480 [candidate division WOR-1 bacterium RIFOXYC2_FULL_37_10]